MSLYIRRLMPLTLLPLLLVTIVAFEARADRFAFDEATLTRLRSYAPSGPVAVIQLGSVGRIPKAIGQWVIGSGNIAEKSGGKRVYAGNLDLGRPGHPDMRFELIIIDEYPDVESAVRALSVEIRGRDSALSGLSVLMARPVSNTIQSTGPVMAHEPAASDAPEPPPLAFPDTADTGPGLDEDMASAFMREDQSDPLVLLELVHTRDQLVRGVTSGPPELIVSGAESWTRYSNATHTRLSRLGGRRIWSARAPRLLAGAENDSLDEEWSEIELTYAPNRLVFRELFASEAQQESLQRRAAGVDRAIVIPGTPWPMYDPTPKPIGGE